MTVSFRSCAAIIQREMSYSKHSGFADVAVIDVLQVYHLYSTQLLLCSKSTHQDHVLVIEIFYYI